MESMIEGNQKEIICKTGLIDEIVDWGITTYHRLWRPDEVREKGGEYLHSIT